MQLPQDAMLLRVFFGERDRYDGRPLHDAIVQKARELQLAGATVLRGPMGFGRNSRIHRANLFELSEDLPIVVEIVESEANILASTGRRNTCLR
jgi:PII-like signaling protein